MSTNTKQTIIIILLAVMLVIREVKHTERIYNLKSHYAQEIAEVEDMAADSCDDRISEILGQF